MKLLYFFDPMCGWSYAFHPVLEKVREAYPNIPISFICGGMVLGKNAGPVGERGEYYLNIIPRLTEIADVTFGDVYKRKLANGTFYNASLKPSVAINIVNSMHPEKTFSFIGAMYHRLFVHGDELQDLFSIETAAVESEIDAGTLSEQIEDEKWVELTQKDFELTQSIGISGFPTLVAEVNEQLYLVNHGYAHLEKVVDSVQSLLDMELAV